ncbi:MAG TPA: helix-turn-helix domain-containing protein [Candidatus Xenobia bacterium]
MTEAEAAQKPKNTRRKTAITDLSQIGAKTWLTVRETCLYMDVSDTQVRNMINERSARYRGFPCYRRFGDVWHINRPELDAWMLRGRA